MDSTPALLYSILSDTYYETIERYSPSPHFAEKVVGIVGPEWTISTGGFWSSCTPEQWVGISHGWKIHVSSTSEAASETLEAILPVLSEAKIQFKFCSDPDMLRMSLSKGWSRFQVGKFITAYPRDEEEFKRIIQHLSEVTEHLIGPHILTDRPYRQSRAVYYRYGAHYPELRIDPYGRSISRYKLKDGSWYEDVRGPSFSLPPGIHDPFVDSRKPRPSQIKAKKGSVLLKNRYKIEGAIKFNATGGIYRGTDILTGARIILREVRGTLGHLESASPDDPAMVLKREARILTKLAPTGLVPEFIDIFQEWQHWFLVVEHIEAVSLWGHSMEFYFSNESQSSDVSLEKIVATIKNIAQGLIKVHASGIVLRDLTKNNILFIEKSNEIKFIDLEFAYELTGEEVWINGWTPGYASRDQASSRRPAVEDDYYALGVLIIDLITFCAAGLEIGRESVLSKLKLTLKDLGLPVGLYDLVEGLIDPDTRSRWTATQAVRYLEGLGAAKQQSILPLRTDLLTVETPSLTLVRRIETINKELLKSIHETADFDRDDRLWPASPEVFITNPISIQHGAAGVAWFQLRATGSVSPKILDWIERHASLSRCPTGFYSGASGVALLLLHAGRRTEACSMWEAIKCDERRNEHPGLYYGAAGWGLVCLHFWHATGQERYLQEAVAVAKVLVKSSTLVKSGVRSWETDGKNYLGLGDGQSGIALFLLYLSTATNDEYYLDVGRQALAFDLSHVVAVGGRSVWKTHSDAKPDAPNLPHTRFGSAGIGSVCIRYHSRTREESLLEVILDCAHTIRTRMSNKIWQDEGASGYGEFFLDCYEYFKDERFRNIAYFHAEAVAAHAINCSAGLAFGGLEHYRICHDYGSGGAGIGVFLDRLLNRRTRLFMLDEMVSV